MVEVDPTLFSMLAKSTTVLLPLSSIKSLFIKPLSCTQPSSLSPVLPSAMLSQVIEVASVLNLSVNNNNNQHPRHRKDTAKKWVFLNLSKTLVSVLFSLSLTRSELSVFFKSLWYFLSNWQSFLLSLKASHLFVTTNYTYVAARICFRFLCLLVQSADQNEIKAADKSLIPISCFLQINNLNQKVSN